MALKLFLLLSSIFLHLLLPETTWSWQVSATLTPPPLPVLPLPTYAQLQWQQREIIMFLHFGVNTFTDSEWGTGKEDPSIFNPTKFDPDQWVVAAKAAGISLMILTAKHHDGFCLWPSKYTDHSVKESPWKGGKGDVVGEFLRAARDGGVDAGLYLSPWDRHEPRYGKTLEYNEFYLGQLQELLAKYGGGIREIWFDGAKGANETKMSYKFKDWFAMVKELQSSINIFSDAGPDVRWVGNENGYAATTSWATINSSALSIGNASIVDYLSTGDPRGVNYMPAECDVSIRPGWFWHKSEKPKTLSHLLNIYYKSVGRNCVLLLNVPPNKSGLLSDIDVHRLNEFKNAIDTIFTLNLAANCSVKASSQRGGQGGGFGPENVLDNDHLWTYWAPVINGKDEHWIELKGSNGGLRFNVVRIQEAIGLGQRIKRHEVYVDGKLVAKGTTVGHKRLHRIKGGVAYGEVVRIRVLESKDLPLISSIGLHFDPFWQGGSDD